MKVVQVLGTNGAGKSTLFRTLALSDPDAQVITGLTLMPALRGVLVGDYLSGKKTPGVDGIHGKTEILAALRMAVEGARAHGLQWVGWEGIIIMTRQYHAEIVARGAEVLYLVLDTAVDECFARIERRSGKTRADLKGDGKIVVGRARGVLSLATWLSEQPGATVVHLDGGQPPWANGTQLLQLLGVQVARTPVEA
jgi:hypothetical protein